jgi:hypothetical protein
MHHGKLPGVLDRSDKLAAGVVFQMLPLLAPPLVDKAAELGAEHVGEATARRGGKAMQQHPRGAVGGENLALIIDRQQPGAQGMQILATVVQGDQNMAAMLFAEQAVLDLGRRHRHQRLGMRLPRHTVR